MTCVEVEMVWYGIRLCFGFPMMPSQALETAPPGESEGSPQVFLPVQDSAMERYYDQLASSDECSSYTAAAPSVDEVGRMGLEKLREVWYGDRVRSSYQRWTGLTGRILW